MLLLLLKAPVGGWIANRAGDVTYYLATEARHAVCQNMHYVLGPQVRPEKLQLVARRVFRNVALNYYDLVRAQHLSNDYVRSRVKFDQKTWQLIEQYRAEGRGIVIAALHFGALDIAGRILQMRGWQVPILVDKVGPPKLFNLMMSFRARNGWIMLPSGSVGTLMNLLRTLRKGGTVCILVDRFPKESGLPVSFFSEPAVLSPIPALLASLSQAVIIPTFCVRQKEKYVLYIETPITASGAGRRDVQVKALTEKLASICERYIKRYPEQWILLTPIWNRTS
jgi:lauroyl/myristoyl acyltransferase